MVFKTGAFQISPNMTPDQVANKRAMIAALLPKFGSAKYVGEGIGQLATGVMAGRQGRKLDEIEGKGTASANSLWERLMGTANSAQSPDMGPLTVLGMKPEGPAMPPPDPNSPHALGDDAMAALGKPAMKTAADPASIKAGLVARGLPEHVAEGFVMNFQDESGLNPGINEAAPTVPGSRGGFGLYQLTGPRRRAYEAYAAEKGVPLDDVDAQLDFMMMELQGPEAAAWSKISGTQNAGEAGAAIVNSFLRPAEEHRASRVAKYLGGTTAAPAPTSAPSIPINELYMALQNPWLSGEQKGLITSMIQEQQQASDPLRQLQIAQAEAELAKTNAPAAPPEELTTRMMLAEQAGLEQGTPEYQTYLLTGELPEQAGSNVPAGFATLDMQAQAAGYAPGTPEYQEFMRNGGASGTPAAFTALDLQARAAGYEPGTPEYQRFMASRGAYERSSDAAIGKAQGEDAALYESMTSKMPGLESVVDELSAIADEATYTSTGQAANWIGKQLGFEPSEAAVARTKYIAMVDNQVLPMLRDTFGAAFTVAEGESLRATLGDPNKTPEEKKVVLEAFIEQKKRDVEALGRRVNGSETPAAPATGATVPITSDAEYDALPSGTMFQGPDGKVRRKP